MAAVSLRSVPAGRVGSAGDCTFASNEIFRQAVVDREAADVSALEGLMQRRCVGVVRCGLALLYTVLVSYAHHSPSSFITLLHASFVHATLILPLLLLLLSLHLLPGWAARSATTSVLAPCVPFWRGFCRHAIWPAYPPSFPCWTGSSPWRLHGWQRRGRAWRHSTTQTSR